LKLTDDEACTIPPVGEVNKWPTNGKGARIDIDISHRVLVCKTGGGYATVGIQRREENNERWWELQLEVMSSNFLFKAQSDLEIVVKDS
jgi:hypothetical protein